MGMSLAMGLSLTSLRNGAAWSPARLLTGASQLAWYDPSDLDTLFQDSAGTTPVTADGQSVGLVLDKSQGLTLGPDLVTNGTFDTDTSGWTSWQTGILSVDSSRLKVENGASTISGAYQVITVVIGRTYQFVADKQAGTALGPRYYLGTSVGGAQYSANASSGQFFVATSTTLIVTASTQTTTLGATAFFDNISVRELPGNHLIQSTAGSRPIYGFHPATGVRNLLERTEEFVNAYWTKTNITLTSGIADPIGGTGAFTFTAAAANGTVSRSVGSLAAGGTISAYVRRRTGTGAVQMWDGNSYNNIVVTGAWERITVSQEVTSTGFWDMRLTVSGDAVDVAFPQVETGSTATAYQKVNTANGVTEAGVPTVHFLKFDGTDDFLVSAANVNPGSVDKVQVFAGVRKASDAARGTIAELSTSIASANGGFHLTAPNAASDTFAFESKGTTLTDAIATGVAAPATRVLTGLGDISGDTAILRVNGVQADADTGDQGTGNYLSAAIYVGRRGGTSLPFNGNLYSLIVRFSSANLDAAVIGQAEAWTAGKTGVTL